MAFWRMLRKVRMWTQTPPEKRQAAFQLTDREAFERLGSACAHAPELVEAFGTFATLIRAPLRVDSDQLAEACRLVYEWADARSMMDTAMLFAEAASTVDPDNPARANDAGRMCRRATRDDRAADWYLRAFGLAVRTESRDESLHALLGYGNLMKDLGRHDEAKTYFERAAQRAHNYGRLRQTGEAHHNLLAIAADFGSYYEGERHVRRALALYQTHHPRLAVLAHDWAFLLVRIQCYTPAMTLLEHAAPRAHTPDLQTLMWGTLARAAAGSRRRERFEHAKERLLPLTQAHEEYAAAALIHLAEGSRAFRDWDRAQAFASSALEVAQRRKDALIERDAVQLMEAISGREPAPVEKDPPRADRVARINEQTIARLQKWKAPSQVGPEASPRPTPSANRQVNQWPDPPV
ncbi:MAG TPA: hypothetical protein VF263_20710 [Longimicrobiaceae bacterium]